MITEWSLESFKSVRGPISLRLGKVTVFAGANSGGKSTVLQSILLLKQTLQYGAPNRPLALNGPIMRLGTMDDVISAKATDRIIGIGFRLDTSTAQATFGAPWMSTLQRATWRAVRQGTVSQICGQFYWSQGAESSSATERLQAKLKSGHLKIERDITAVDDKEIFFADYSIRHQGEQDRFDVRLDPLSEAEVFDERPEAKATAAHVSHFLPSWVEVQFNETRQRARNIAATIFSTNSPMQRANAVHTAELAPNSVLALINEWLASQGHDLIPSEPSPTIGDIAEHVRPLMPKRSFSLNLTRRDLEPTTLLEIQQLQDSVETIIVDEQAYPRRATDIEMPRSVNQGVEFLKSYFKLGIRYLGPLRDEPRPVYPLEIVENPTDVGYKGEHTAAVLELNARKHVSYVRAPSADGIVPQNLTSKPLVEAVKDWLAYLGVADNVVAHEQGVFGNRLQVQTPGLSKWHDLTNVGVGVSQVLPIVVSALLAPSSSLLIFEQPELHLHPRVQARLGDFFLSLSLAGKRCILETHSEYMIERFRLRVAESDSNLQDDLMVYFAERNDGETNFRPVPISRYGAVIDWPDDFFDQSQHETSRILQAAARKRSTERSKTKT